MTTTETVRAYFDALSQLDGWESLIAEDFVFTSLTAPAPRRVEGKEAYLQATRRFFAMVRSATPRELLEDGDRASVITHYTLQPPTGAAAFESDVAEFFTVRDGKITALTICFDTAPYPR